MRLYNRALTTADISGIYNYVGVPPDTTPPSTPLNVSAVAVSSTQIHVSWSASTDNVGVTGYQVFRSGTLVGTVTGLSYSDTGLTPSTAYSYTVAAFDAAGNSSNQSSTATATTLVADTTPPSVSITAPAANATVSNTVTVSATASDDVGVAGVQFKLDGNNLGSAITAAPYSVAWDTTTVGNGSHVLTAVAQDTSNNVATSASVTVTVSNTPPPVPTQGLIGYWNFDENSGTLAHDTSGNGYNGTVTGATWTTGKINSALSFNGSTTGVVTLNIAISNSYSISTWVNPAVTTQGAYVRIAETQYNAGFYLGTNSSGTKYKFIVNNGSGATGSCGAAYGCAEGGTITSGWHLITATYDGTTARLYVDTSQVAMETFNAPATSNLPLYIGRYYGGNGLGWNGSIDEVRLYNRALTTADISGIYNYVGAPPDTTPPSTPLNVSAVAVSSTQIHVSWSASTDNVGVTGYQVFRSGTLVGTVTGLSYSDTGLTPSTAYSYTVAAFDAAGNSSNQSSAAIATTLTPDTTPPSVSITAPAANATVSNTVTVSATASDDVGVAGVQFKLDGNNLGSVITAAPYSVAWDTTTVGNGSHVLTAVAQDTSNNVATSATVTVTVSNTPPPVPTQGLIGYWNFDEDSGTLAYDTSGSGYNGTVNGANWTTGEINSALSFNGSTSAVVTPNIPLGNTFSVSAWVNSTSGQRAFVRILETQYNGGLYLGTNSSGAKYKFIVNTGTGSTGSCGAAYGCAEGGAIAAGWHLITGTFDGVMAKLYVDNTLVATETFSGPPNTNFPLYIGRYYGGTGAGWNGSIDEVRLYNRALTSTEVSGIYNYTGAPPDTAPPSIPLNVLATVISGTQINVSWSASTDNVGVTGYQVFRNGTVVGAVTGLSYSDTGLTPSTTYSYTVSAFDGAGNNSGQSSAVNATTLTPDTIPPTVSITAPAPNATVSNTVTVSATAADNVAVADVQFKLDGTNLGSAITTAPYSISWDTTTASNGPHTLTAIARDTSNNVSTLAAVIVTASNTVSSAPTQGLIGYWSFDEGAGNAAHDISGSGYMGTINGAAWTTGKINSALSFNGSTNYVVTSAIPLGSAFSVSTWVNPTTTQGAYVRILETQYDGGLYLGTNSSGAKYKFIVNTGTGSTGSCGAAYGCAEGGTIAAGWHLITGTFDGVMAKLYVDNTLVATETFGGPPNTNFPLYIGRYYGGTGAGWNGSIDEVRLYNRALTSTEVSGIYNYTGAPPDTTPPSIPSNVSATVISGTQINVSWSASTDNVGVTGYQVFRNGTVVGAVTGLSYSDTGLTPSTTYSYTVSAFDGAGNNSGQSSAVNATTLTPDTIPPTVSITAPAPNATVSNTVTVSATAADNVAVAAVQLKLDGTNLGSAITTAPYSISWDTTTASNGPHTLTAIARDTSNNVGTSAAVSVTASNTVSSVPTQGLIGYWSFDEGAGNVAHDISGSGYMGTINGAAWTTGKINSALSFNGSTNDVVTPAISLGSAFSVSAWVNPATTQGTYVRILETQYNGGLYLGTNSSGAKYKFIVNTGTGSTGSCGAAYGCAEGGTIAAGWHLITGTFDGTTARLYVDTSQVATETFSGPPNTNFPLYIGRYYGGTGAGWNGAIDEVRLYNRALTAAEVSGIYSYVGGPADTAPPSIPSNVLATAVSGTQINVSWSASTDNVGVTGYQVFRNGTVVGAVTGLSYSDTGLTPSTTYSYTVSAFDGAGNSSNQSSAATTTTLIADTTPPSVSIIAPAANATVSNTVVVSATASDDVGVANVQFTLDGNNLGPAITTAPYSIFWDTTAASNGPHTLTAVARDTSNNAATSIPVSVTVDNSVRTVTWTQMTPGTTWPGYSGLLQLFYATPLQRTIVYTVVAGSSDIYASDIFLYNASGNTFSHLGGTGVMGPACTLDTPTQPGERHPYWQMAVDTKRNYMWMASGSNATCGGIGQPNNLTDLYYLDLGASPPAWHRVVPADIEPHINSALIYDPDDDVLFLFGGSAEDAHFAYCPTIGTPNPGVLTARQSAAGCIAPDDWARITPFSGTVNVNGTAVTLVSGSSFANVAPGDYMAMGGLVFQVASVTDPGHLVLTANTSVATNELYYFMPPAVANPGLVYDGATRKVLLFGGNSQTGGAFYNQVWSYDVPARTWTHKALFTTTPPVNTSGGVESNQPAMAYNNRTGKILYHQSSITGGGPADWQYDPVADTWTELKSIGVGPSRGTSLAYDSVNNVLVAWSNSGGGAGTTPEIWQGQLWSDDTAASITATAGSGQSTGVNTGFATALQATVKDAVGNGVSGVTVTFTAPGSGASGTFGGTASASGVSNSSGVATAPSLTANSQAGSYTVTASVAGVSAAASYSLTNTAGAAASITATAGSGQSTGVNTGFATALQATVKDAVGNGVSGVTVTFTAPGSGASGTFGGTASASGVSNSSGVATAPSLTANSQAGSYTVTASVAGVSAAASYSLTNTAGAAASITATAGSGQSTGVNTGFATALQATVKDAVGNGVSGVTVTFTAPGSGASGTFGGTASASGSEQQQRGGDGAEPDGEQPGRQLHGDGECGRGECGGELQPDEHGGSGGQYHGDGGERAEHGGQHGVRDGTAGDGEGCRGEWCERGDGDVHGAGERRQRDVRGNGQRQRSEQQQRRGDGAEPDGEQPGRQLHGDGECGRGERGGELQPDEHGGSGGQHHGDGGERAEHGGQHGVRDGTAGDGEGCRGEWCERGDGDVHGAGERRQRDVRGNGQRQRSEQQQRGGDGAEPDGEQPGRQLHGDGECGRGECGGELQPDEHGGSGGQHHGDSGERAEHGGQHGVRDGAAGDGEGCRGEWCERGDGDVHGAGERRRRDVRGNGQRHGSERQQRGGDGAEPDGEQPGRQLHGDGECGRGECGGELQPDEHGGSGGQYHGDGGERAEHGGQHGVRDGAAGDGEGCRGEWCERGDGDVHGAGERRQRDVRGNGQRHRSEQQSPRAVLLRNTRARRPARGAFTERYARARGFVVP